MIYVSSDWHGVPLEVIQTLLKKANVSEEDFVFVLGDVIDRGEHGIDLLKWLMLQPNMELILGNHEAMMLACDFIFEEIREDTISCLNYKNLQLLQTWQYNGGETTIRALSHETPETREALLDYLRDSPFYEEVCAGERDFVLIHAGFDGYEEGKPLENYDKNQLLFTRPSLNAVYSHDFMTIFGHTPTGYYGSEFRSKMIKTKTWCNIDTGAAGGGMPMLLCLDTMQEYYVNE